MKVGAINSVYFKGNNTAENKNKDVIKNWVQNLFQTA